MKKTILVLLMFITLIFFVGCKNEEPSTNQLKNMIDEIGTVDYLDTEWGSAEPIKTYGTNTFVLLDTDEKDFIAIYSEDSFRVIGIMIDYQDSMLSNKIKIKYIEIIFADYKKEIALDVVFSDNTKNVSFESEDHLGNYLKTLDFDSIYDLLFEMKLITK